MEKVISIHKGYFAIILLLLGVVVVLLTVTERERDIYISGAQYEYAIPHKYAKNKDSIIYPGEYVGDQGKAISLLIPSDDELALPDLNGDGVSLLIFSDKRYSPSESLLPFAKKIAQESSYGGKKGLHFEYADKSLAERNQYLITFDPNATKQGSLSEMDYIVRIQHFADIEIGVVKKRSKPLCVMHSVVDGFAMQLSLSGDLCNQEDVIRLKIYQDNLLRNWSKSKLNR